jgi:hypothetical protein
MLAPVARLPGAAYSSAVSKQGAVDCGHDLGEASLDVLERPRVSAGVLLYLQGGDRDAARAGSLARTEGDTRVGCHPYTVRRGGHVGALNDCDAAILYQPGDVPAGQLALRGRRYGNLAGHVPDVAAFDERSCWAAFRVVAHPSPLDELDFLQGIDVDPVRAMYEPVRV